MRQHVPGSALLVSGTLRICRNVLMALSQPASLDSCQELPSISNLPAKGLHVRPKVDRGRRPGFPERVVQDAEWLLNVSSAQRDAIPDEEDAGLTKAADGKCG